MRLRTPALALLAVAFTASHAAAQTPTPTPSSSPQPTAAQAAKPAATPAATSAANAKPGGSYVGMLERARRGDRSIDFGAMRMAYTETADYNPYGGDVRREMFGALGASKFEEALSVAEKALEKNYVDLNAHYVAFVANRELKRVDRAEFHRTMFAGLIESIQRSGDGKSAETAFVVISTTEEYVLLNVLGLRPAGQALIHDKGHSYDLMTGVDPKTNESVKLFFNIDKPFGWLGNRFKDK